MKVINKTLSILTASFVLSATLFAQSFTKITTGPIVNNGLGSTGGSWADYDNDGDLDLFAPSGGVANNLLYRNEGTGFIKINSGAIVNDVKSSSAYGNSWGDYDGDGDLDLFVSTNNGVNNFLYRNDGNGNFSKITSGNIVNDGGYSVGSSWVDFDNDGDLDLWVDNEGAVNEPGHNNFLYRNDGAGSFTKITDGTIVTDSGHSFGSSWGDYDNDGDQDLLVPNQFGENNFLYRNDGNGDFTGITTGDIVNDGGDSKACSWADYDNDGDLDLFVANAGENNFLYRNEGNDNFTKITAGNIVNDGGQSRGNGWADIDNDGDLDLFVANRGTENNNFLYRNDGEGTFTRLLTGVVVNDSSASMGSSWGDYNNDGFLDLFVAIRGGDNNNLLYQNDGNSNHLINILCIGTVSNTTAIGAKIRVKATISGTPVWQLRDIAGQSGYASQNSLNAEFGLGDATLIDSLKIEWPSGIVETYTNLAVDQFMTATENGGITGVDEISAPVPNQFELSQNYPNPFNPSTTIEFVLVNRSAVKLQVFDILGREVATLVDEALPPGSYKTVFEATGLASGVYFYRITAGELVQTKRLLLLK